MRTFEFNRFVCVFILSSLASLIAYSQHEHRLGTASPIENRVADRDVALRIRTEVQLSEDDEALLEEDVSYARFPVNMFAGEIKLFGSGGYTLGSSYDFWENHQDLDSRRWSVNLGIPLGNRCTVFLKQMQHDSSGNPLRDYSYAAVSYIPVGSCYAYTQYGYFMQDGVNIAHQASQYLNILLSRGCRVGGQLSYTYYTDSATSPSCYGSLFGSAYLWKDATSVSLEGRYYESGSGYAYQEARAYLYQKIGDSSLLRLGYRYYTDSDLDSHALDLRARHYFSPRFSAHVGYRFYWHSDGTDFNTALAGLGLII